MIRVLAIICMTAFLAACSPSDSFPQDTFPADIQLAIDEILPEVLSKDVDRILAVSDTELKERRRTILYYNQYIPAGTLNYEVIGREIRRIKDVENPFPLYLSAYELTDGNRFAMLYLNVGGTENCCKLSSINVESYESSPTQLNDFTLGGKQLTNYLFLFIAIFIPMFIIATLIACWRNKKVNKKWRWRVFIVFGLYGLVLNWTTGAITPNFLSYSADTGELEISFIKFLLLGAGTSKTGLFEPWMIDIGFPLGACLYWWYTLRNKFVPAPKKEKMLPPVEHF